jgi:hypothetical protein
MKIDKTELKGWLRAGNDRFYDFANDDLSLSKLLEYIVDDIESYFKYKEKNNENTEGK